MADNIWAGGDFQQPPRTDGEVGLCGACRRIGQCRLGLGNEHLDGAGTAHFSLFCPRDHEGGPGVAHGGWTAAMLDEVCGHVPMLHNQLSVTGTLTVRFVKPVPIERPLEARAWIERKEARKWFISAELTLVSSGATLATATGIWVLRDAEAHFGGFQRWLTEQDRPPADQPAADPSAITRAEA